MQDLKINILLSALDITHDDIAEALGVTRPLITMTIKGNRKSRRTQERITKYLRERVTVHALFGVESIPAKTASTQKSP